jgi:hypothetical protein
MKPHHDPNAPPEPPEAPEPVVPGVGSVSPPAPGTEGLAEEDDHEIDPHPDTPDDFDDDVVGERESVETVIHKDG